MRRFISILVLFFITFSVYCQIRIAAPELLNTHYIEGYILCDSSNRLTIDSLIRNNYPFCPFNAAYGPLSDNYTYWIRFKMPEISRSNLPIVTSAMKFKNFDVYIPDADSGFILYQTGFEYFYPHWPIRIYSTSTPLPVIRNDRHYFIRVKQAMKSGMGIQIKDVIEVLNTSVHNFFGYGFFFGICLIIALYMLIFFFFIREKTYLFYSLYVLSFLLFGIVSWGFLCWPLSYFHIGWINDYYTIPYASMTIFLLLYSRSFLSVKENLPFLGNIMLFSVYVRIGIYFSGLLSGNNFFYNPNNDSLLLLPAWIAGIVSWIRGYKPARYLTIGFSVLYAGFLEHSLHYVRLITSDTRILSLFNTGAAEIILFSLALADRFRMLKNEKENATESAMRLQQEVIAQLKENELLKDKMNKELEERVKERTLELEKANITIKNINDLLKAHNIQLESDIKSIAEKRVLDEPLTYEEFKKIYPDELACYAFIEKLKWGNGFECSKCRNTKYSPGTTPFSRRCSKCNYIERITSNTIFSRIKIPINKAFYMLFLLGSGKKLTLNELSAMLSVRRQTCWAFKKKIDAALNQMPGFQHQKNNWEKLILFHADEESVR